VNTLRNPRRILPTPIVPLLAELAQVLPPASLLSAAEDLKPYECDGLSAYRQVPLAVALPETEAQVVAVIKACRSVGARSSRAVPAPGFRPARCRIRRAWCCRWRK
jgi:hypothetical protein